MARAHRAGRWGAALAIGALFALSLARTFEYPDRISTLPSLQVDAAAYDTIGTDLANRLTIDAVPPLQPPGFVTFLALIFKVFGHSWPAAKIALWAIWICVTLMAGWLARRLSESELAGWIAALLCAGSPALGWYTQTLQYEVLAALFVIGIVMLASAMPLPRNGGAAMRQAAILGALVGAAALTREVLLVLLPLVALMVGQRVRETAGMRAASRAAAVLILVAASLPLGWSALQSTRAGRAVALSDKGPLVLAFGNNPRANGTFNAGLAGVGEPSGLRFIQAEPVQASRLAVRKILYFWGVLRDGWNVPRPAAVWASRATAGRISLERWLPWARGGWILVMSIVALLLWPHATWRAWWIVPSAIVLVMLVHVVTVSSHRFAVPILPLAFAMVAGPLARALQTVARRPAWRVSGGLLIACALVMQLFSWPMTYHLRAADMDGVSADSIHDDGAGGVVRAADTQGGRRWVVGLVDEFLPAGAFDVRLTTRAEDPPSSRDPGAAFRMTVTTLDGRIACAHDVSASALDSTFRTLSLPCVLDRSGPVTLLIETLAVVPLRFSDVTLNWR